MQAGFGAGEVRQLDRHHGDADSTQNLAELAETLGVGAEPLPHRQGVVVEPEEVTAFGRGLSGERTEDGDAERREALSQRRLLTAAQRLAHAQEDGAAI